MSIHWTPKLTAYARVGMGSHQAIRYAMTPIDPGAPVAGDDASGHSRG